MKYKIAVLIGRFQPCHNMHIELLRKALSLGEQVLVLLGSAKTAPTIKNPFPPALRERMLRSCLTEEENARVSFAGIRDYPYHENVWISEIQNVVTAAQEEFVVLPEGSEAQHGVKLAEVKVCLVGHEKDGTSYYLKLFPQWTYEPFYKSYKEAIAMDSTAVRDWYLDKDSLNIDSEQLAETIPPTVLEILEEFYKTEDYERLAEEYAYFKQYKKDSTFVGLPYKPIFATTDAVVTCKGHILLVQRGVSPGKGLYALPGGFLEADLTFLDNVIKEVKEETRINIPAPLLKSLVKSQKIFDNPHRSIRGRTITQAFHIPIDIKIEEGLPHVKGGDDATKAFWLPINSLGDIEDKMLEDHYHIAKWALEV